MLFRSEHKKHNDAEIEKKQEEVNQSNQQVTQLTKDIGLIQKHIEVLNSKIADKLTSEKKSSKLVQLESKLETRLKKLEKEEKFYEENHDCPTCKQGIDEIFRSSQLSGINKTKGEIGVAVTDIESQIQATSQRLQEIQKIVKHIQEHNNEIVKHNSTISAIHTYISKTQRDIQKIGRAHV